ncbi:MAG TPA: ribbon-helix-helix protein, CopG family [Chloroflexota bacterium]|jgi:plasmid stability protein
MAHRSLPVYLTPEQHRALQQLSARSGRSMSDLVREMLQTYLLGEELPTDLSDLAGAVDLGRPTDISRDRDDLLSDALRALR